MPDEGLVPEDLGASFDEQFREKQAAARAERDAQLAATQEAPAQEPPDGGARPRDEHGRFMAALDPDGRTDDGGNDDDDGGDEPPSEPQELILGKFKDADAVIEAYANLERRLAEQGDELAEQRRIAEHLQKLDERIKSWEESPEPTDPSAYQQTYETDGPRAAIIQLLQEERYPGDPLYDRYMGQWIREEPEEALPVHTEVKFAIMQRQFDARLRELQAPIVQTRTQQEFTEAYQRVRSEITDLDSLPLMEAAKQPWFQRELEFARSVEDRERVIRGMATYARGLAVPSIQQQAVQATEAAEAEARRQRDMAVVASGSQVNREPPRTRQEQILEQIRAEAMEYTGGARKGIERANAA